MIPVVAGGGPAGAACACLLARAGHRVLLIEREAGPVDKICGEFISAEAQHYLAAIGFSLTALGARPIGRLRLVHGTRIAEAALPFTGLSLTRRTLDEALLRHAAAAGVELLRGHAIRSIRTAASPVLDVAGVGEIAASTVFLATGKHDVRGQRRMPSRAPEDLVGFKNFFWLDPAQAAALDGYVEIILFPGGYAGLQMVEGGAANLCLLVDRARFEQAGQCWESFFNDLMRTSPHLKRRLRGAVAKLDRPLSIFRVPYGFLHAPTASDPSHLFRLGDQVGVIPSFSGDGISIALHSAHRAAGFFLNGQTAAAFHHRMRRDLRGQFSMASLLYWCGRLPVGPALLTAAAQAFPKMLCMAAMLTRVPVSPPVAPAIPAPCPSHAALSRSPVP